MKDFFSRRSFLHRSAAVTGGAGALGLAGCGNPRSDARSDELACPPTLEMIHGHCGEEFSAVRDAFDPRKLVGR